ncbi:MAG: hypothetical protein ABSA42_00140 [Terracidiphilus sp.]|jgi:hypothetical protein
MTITGNEVAVDNQMRRADRQNRSPVNRLLEGAETAATAVSLATGSIQIGSIAKVFGIAKRFTSGLGVATLEENLNHLGDATEAALSRVEENLNAQGVRIDEIERRLNSNELLEGIKAATLQAQRTKDKKRLERMALILANGVAKDDLEPESLDDMMRAAVELTTRDVFVLSKLVEAQGPRVPAFGAGVGGSIINNAQSVWVSLRDNGLISTANSYEIRVNLEKLKSFGFCFEIPISAAVSYLPDVLASPLGIKFIERLQEIGAEK